MLLVRYWQSCHARGSSLPNGNANALRGPRLHFTVYVLPGFSERPTPFVFHKHWLLFRHCSWGVLVQSVRDIWIADLVAPCFEMEGRAAAVKLSAVRAAIRRHRRR